MQERPVAETGFEFDAEKPLSLLGRAEPAWGASALSTRSGLLWGTSSILDGEFPTSADSEAPPACGVQERLKTDSGIEVISLRPGNIVP